jgi:HD-GYP domain-containing protein (c-di-GMP phosphodiesterase class II)
MTTNRVYMPARTPEDGLEEVIRHSGTQFEPVIVEAFTEWWHKKYRDNDSIIQAQSTPNQHLIEEHKELKTKFLGR